LEWFACYVSDKPFGVTLSHTHTTHTHTTHTHTHTTHVNFIKRHKQPGGDANTHVLYNCTSNINILYMYTQNKQAKDYMQCVCVCVCVCVCTCMCVCGSTVCVLYTK